MKYLTLTVLIHAEICGLQGNLMVEIFLDLRIAKSISSCEIKINLRVNLWLLAVILFVPRQHFALVVFVLNSFEPVNFFHLKLTS